MFVHQKASYLKRRVNFQTSLNLILHPCVNEYPQQKSGRRGEDEMIALTSLLLNSRCVHRYYYNALGVMVNRGNIYEDSSAGWGENMQFILSDAIERLMRGLLIDLRSHFFPTA